MQHTGRFVPRLRALRATVDECGDVGPPLPRPARARALRLPRRPLGALNFFQRMMLRWRELHPYNPVHVVRVPVALDAERLRDAIAERGSKRWA